MCNIFDRKGSVNDWFNVSRLNKAFENVEIFHAGTVRSDTGACLATGGRVLNVTGIGATVAEAQAAAHDHAEGETCDKADPKKDGSGEGAGCDAPVQDNRIYMIRGTGAVIQS